MFFCGPGGNMHIHRAERLWIIFGVGMLVVFLATSTTAAIVDGFVPPSRVQSIDPTKVSTTPPFDHPGLRKISQGYYEAYYVGQIFSWNPSRISLPVGSHVTFYVTSADVEHGFSVPETGINTMVTPGWVSSVSCTPGTFLIVCNEYCGAAHQTMAASIEVK
jgi:cytochrome c oxidase subunit 2